MLRAWGTAQDREGDLDLRELLAPIAAENEFTLNIPEEKKEKIGEIKEYYPVFTKWDEPHPERWRRFPEGRKRTYTIKPLIDAEGEPVFGELAILRRLQKHGWEGRWVDAFHGGKQWTRWPDTMERLPKKERELYKAICRRNGQIRGEMKDSSKGLWDVFAWREDEYLFVESKGKDTMNANQYKWLEAAIDTVDLSRTTFGVVTWRS